MHTAALFDLDGVIIDTEGQYTDFWKGIGERFFQHMPDFSQRIKGHTLKQIINEFFANNIEQQHYVVEQLNAFEKDMEFPYIKGAIEFVKALRHEHIATAIVTSSNQAKMQCLYQHHAELPDLFDHIFTAENARRSKPAPDCYIDAAKAMGYNAADCFVFEDSMSGLQAGHDSGAIVIGLTTTNTAERIAPLCQHVMHDFTDIEVNLLHQLKAKNNITLYN